MLAHFLKSSHLVQIKERGIEQFTGENIGILAVSDELWAVFFKVDFDIVLQKSSSCFSLCYLHSLLGDVYHPARGYSAYLPHWQGSGKVSLGGFAGWKLRVCLMAIGKSSQGGKNQDAKSSGL